MKLSIVQVREKVPTHGPGEMTARLTSEDGPAPSFGWSLTFEAGIVTATKGDASMLIPIGNVVWMRLLVAEAKPAKPVKAA